MGQSLKWYFTKSSSLCSPQFYQMDCLPEEITVKPNSRQADSKVHDAVFRLAAAIQKPSPVWPIDVGLFHGFCDV